MPLQDKPINSEKICGTGKQAAKADLELRAINTIRFLAVDAVEKANSGHPGMPMGMAPAAYVLWTRFMKYNPKNPNWAGRDRFVLSAGHGSMLLYALLHLTGYDLTLDDLKNFRQFESRTPGHPEYGFTAGVETTTGPLGQGIATAVGMAMAQRYLNSLLTEANEAPLLNSKVYGIVSDGDLMEGVGNEAASLAGHLGLSSMIFFYDDNHISIDGNTDLSFNDNIPQKFEAMNWYVQSVSDANDLDAIAEALENAKREKSRPSLIAVRSIIGYGSPNKGNTAEAHGAPLGPEETKLTKENLKWPLEPTFFIPEGVKTHFEEAIVRGQQDETEWNKKFDSWAKAHPEKFNLWKRLEKQELPAGWESKLPDFSGETKMATRAASGKVINALAPLMPELIGGSADLAPSNNTLIKGAANFSPQTPGRNLHFGVREHAMSAALNGLSLSNMLIPYGGTFLIFMDYMKGGMRLSALMEKRVIYILTHDSVGLGEDGPTHQPIEQLAQLRATPHMSVIRPADANETAAAWRVALLRKDGPTALILSRQNLPVLSKATYPSIGQVDKGGYILSEAKAGSPKIILIATGSEVQLALGAQTQLESAGFQTRVVSLPSWDIFQKQPASYIDSVLPPSIKARVSIEAATTFGWAKWVGPEGVSIGIDHFGASAPGNIVLEKFGFTVDNIVTQAKKLIR